MRDKIKDKWRDLGPRVVSGLALAAVGGGAIFAGGTVFLAFISIAAGLMIWEVSRMAAPGQDLRSKVFGVIGGIAVFVSIALPMSVEGLIFAAVAAMIGLTATRDRLWLSLYALLVMSACGAMWILREMSLGHTLWLVLVVVTSDVLGYFAGRSLGGPKFWPAVSPKKTWSGTIAGWIGAAVVGLWFVGFNLSDALPMMAVSVIMAFAGQMGDIVESALKRRAGIKDSSNLIPGHGGLMDRFDALMFAAIVLGTFLVVMGEYNAVHGFR